MMFVIQSVHVKTLLLFLFLFFFFGLSLLSSVDGWTDGWIDDGLRVAILY